jgi:hypothetical protein
MSKRERHGLSNRPEYRIWKGIRKRCLNSNADNFKYYGGRGIRVCGGFDSFLHFFKIVGDRPTDKHCIDRIDNDSHYSCGECPECIQNDWTLNVHWVTHKENCRNARHNRLIEYKGETKTLTEWAEETGINHMNISRRIDAGWTIHDALTFPPDSTGNQPNTLPESLHQEILDRYNSGESLVTVGKHVGFNPEAVRKVLKKHNLEIRDQGEQRKLEIMEKSHTLTYEGQTKTISQWARQLKLRPNTILMRLKRGWSVAKTLTTPVRSRSCTRQGP